MSDCINWKYGKSGQGYGHVTIAGTVRPVHRLMFWIVNGYYPEVVRHKCDNPSCYNPEHLLGGTAKDNVRDMYDRGRDALPYGEVHYMTKLNESDVLAVLERWAAGHRVVSIAEDYGYSVRGMYGVVLGSTWKHINREQYHERRKENIFANTSNRGGAGSRKEAGKRASHRRIENGQGDDTKGIEKGGDMTRYKDGRTLTAFRLSDDERKKLEDLAELDQATNSDVMRNLINRSWKARVRIIGHTRPG